MELVRKEIASLAETFPDDMEIDGPKEEDTKPIKITDEEMRQLVQKENLQDIKQATGTFGLIVGEKDILKPTSFERK